MESVTYHFKTFGGNTYEYVGTRSYDDVTAFLWSALPTNLATFVMAYNGIEIKTTEDLPRDSDDILIDYEIAVQEVTYHFKTLNDGVFTYVGNRSLCDVLAFVCTSLSRSPVEIRLIYQKKEINKTDDLPTEFGADIMISMRMPK